ncbi:MAG: PQQ-dependent sugar dehydrogenase, partial [Marinobacter sp.]|nr:PQQ-dependent sugar dehydrogenase [Marinobacter sp.]
MENRTGWRRIMVGFLLALAFGVCTGTLVQTQINLLALQNLGVDIGFAARLETTLEDLMNFAPIYAIVFGASFLVSQVVAAQLVRRFGLGTRAPFLALGAAVGLWATLRLVDALAPMPTLIAATRGAGGLLAMLATAALSGWLFAALTARRLSRPARGTVALVLLGCVGLSTGEEARAQPSVEYRVETVAEGLEHPWSLAFLPGGG